MRKFSIATACFALVFALGFIPSAAQAANYVGVGVTVRQDNSVFVIADLVRQGPAERAGVIPGDLLLRIDGRSLQGLSLEQVISLMRGDIATPVLLTLLSRGASVTHDLSIVREYIEIPCFIEGYVNLRLQGDDRFGTISGWIGNDYVNWNVNYGRVSAYIKGESLALQLLLRPGRYLELSGWIHNQFMSWTTYNGDFNFYQACIP